mmetsp:Transcript_32194/g.74923  ORF Transcript_32194/g.74923 Transcript_32194/m.74923 type:complete len:244 (-) Transcript_32194:838-1569(-)
MAAPRRYWEAVWRQEVAPHQAQGGALDAVPRVRAPWRLEVILLLGWHLQDNVRVPLPVHRDARRLCCSALHGCAQDSRSPGAHGGRQGQETVLPRRCGRPVQGGPGHCGRCRHGLPLLHYARTHRLKVPRRFAARHQALLRKGRAPRMQGAQQEGHRDSDLCPRRHTSHLLEPAGAVGRIRGAASPQLLLQQDRGPRWNHVSACHRLCKGGQGRVGRQGCQVCRARRKVRGKGPPLQRDGGHV